MLDMWFTQLTTTSFLEFAYNPKIKEEDVANRIDMYFLFSLIWSVGAITDEIG